MFMDLEVMKKDSYALEESSGAGDPSNSVDGLSKVYKDILGVCSAHAQVYSITHQK